MIGVPDPHLGERAAALVDGELGQASREVALAHLVTCDACRAEVAQQRRLKARLRELESPEPPPELTGRLAALAAERPPVAPSPWTLHDNADTVPLPALAGRVLQPRSGRRRASLQRLQPAGRRDANRPARSPRHRRHPVRMAVAGGVSLLALGITAFIAGGDPSGPRVVPDVQRWSVEHASTTGEVPFEMPQPQLVNFRSVSAP